MYSFEDVKDLPEQRNNPLPVLVTDASQHITHANPAGMEWLTNQTESNINGLPNALQHALDFPSEKTRLTIANYSFTSIHMAETNENYLFGWPSATSVSEPQEATAAMQTALSTVSAMDEGMLLCDTHGMIKEVNDAFLRITQKKESDFLHRKLQEILKDVFEKDHDELNQFISNALLQNKQKGTLYPTPLKMGKNMEKRWVVPCCSNIYGGQKQPLGIVFILCDVTHLVNTEQKLLQNEKQYRELVENVNNMIFRVSPDLTIRFTNHYAQEYFGFDKNTITGKSLIEALFAACDDDIRYYQKIWKDIFQHPEIHGTHTTQIVRSNGEKVWIQWTNRAIHDAEGKVHELLCVGTDITYIKELEEQSSHDRIRLRKLALALSNTSERERHAIACQLHDTAIQTLSLANIRLGGLLQQPADKQSKPDEKLRSVRKLLEDGIQECRQTMMVLTPPLLYEAGLIPALNDFINKQQERMDCNIELDVASEWNHQTIPHPVVIFQCSRELIMNALKHARCSNITIQMHIAPNASDIVISVSDDGIGFDPSVLHDHSHSDNSGFGMFTIKERLHEIGGELHVESTPNQGTTATINIPFIAE